ncbi:TPA: aminotransferase class V-fold PLP-dependent enzyme [Bacillus cereus]|nr:aminotransferase class V-fold PLP-dependent enzyme [Bacillus cereus]
MNVDKKQLGDWDPSQFEEHGIHLLNSIRKHFEHIRDVPISSSISPKELLSIFDHELPEKSEPFSEIMNETWEKVVPHLTHWNHPSFHGYFSNSASFPGILAELLISSLNVNAMVWKASPSASTLEGIVLKWIAELVGYNPLSDGVLVNGASLATFYALAAARDQCTNVDVRKKGLVTSSIPKMRVYTSNQAHSSIDKAAIALGIGTDNVIHISTDKEFKMQTSQLEHAIQADIQKGYCPMAVIATVGTTATGAVDPIVEIAKICKKYNIWFHVDAAYGGFWNLVPGVKQYTENLIVADSLVVNPHKCLYTPLEVSVLFCQRKKALSNSFSLVPEYLQTQKDEGAIDYMDYSLQLGRNFRALKLWWIIRSFGKEGLSQRLEESLRLKQWLELKIKQHPDFVCVNSSPFALLCIRYIPRKIQQKLESATHVEQEESRNYVNYLNQELLTQVNQTKKTFLSHAMIPDGYTIRISIGNIHTTEEDIQKLWDLLQNSASKISATVGG